MFMNPVSHVGDLQVYEYDLSVSSNQRAQYNEVNGYTSQSFSEIGNDRILIATNSNGLQWKVRSDVSHVSQSQMTWSNVQPGISTNPRPLRQVDGNASVVRLGKRCRGSVYTDEILANNDVYVKSTLTSMPLENRENMTDSGESTSNLEPMAKRRRVFPEGTLSYISPDKVQEINFGSLVDPGDDIISPYKIPPANTDYFVVQTPSKALNESDQQSFHLSSPISNFSSLGISSAICNKKNANSSFKPRVLFRDVSSWQAGTPSRHSLSPQSSILPRVIVNNNSAPRIGRFNIPPSTASTTIASQQRISVIHPLHRTLSSESDSIAVSTAKMTVWNRMLTSPPIAPTTTSLPTINISQQNVPVRKQYPSASPNNKLSYRVNKNPELSIRRILQNLTNKKWRLVALGENRCTQGAVQMARQMLNTN